MVPAILLKFLKDSFGSNYHPSFSRLSYNPVNDLNFYLIQYCLICSGKVWGYLPSPDLLWAHSLTLQFYPETSWIEKMKLLDHNPKLGSELTYFPLVRSSSLFTHISSETHPVEQGTDHLTSYYQAQTYLSSCNVEIWLIGQGHL